MKIATTPFAIDYLVHHGEAKMISDYIAELEAKVEQSSQSGWQPINTAPRDGTHILVSVHGASVWQMFWGVPVSLQLGGNVSEADKRWVTSVGCYVINGITTHWMPIPKPPEKEMLS